MYSIMKLLLETRKRKREGTKLLSRCTRRRLFFIFLLGFLSSFRCFCLISNEREIENSSALPTTVLGRQTGKPSLAREPLARVRGKFISAYAE